MKIVNITYPTSLDKIDDTFNDNIDIFVETEYGIILTFTVCTPQFYTSYMNKSGKGFVPAGIPDIIVNELTDENIHNAVADYCKSNGYWLKSYYILGLMEDGDLDKIFYKIINKDKD